MHGYDAGHCYDPCGYGQTAPSYGYGYPSQVAGAATPHGAGKGFALIVVLFILLIIVGASKYHC